MVKFSVTTVGVDHGSVDVELNTCILDGLIGRIDMFFIDTDQLRVWE